MSETPNAGVPTPPAKRRPTPKLLVPTNDAALSEVAQTAGDVWATEPTLTLRWLPQADFVAARAQFQQEWAGKRADAATRSPQVQRLDELDDDLKEGLRFLKNYIQEEAGSKAAAEAQYAGYGLVRRSGGGYSLPRDRGERAAALKTLAAKVQGASFAARKYGADFWTPRHTEYAALVQQTGTLAGTVAKQTGSKNAAKKRVRKGLKALVLLLEANFPDTYEAELQRWGFRPSTY